MPNLFRCFKSSPEVIRVTVMLYVRYPLSLRNVEDLLAERGIDVSYETVRFWWNRFGPIFAAEIRQRRLAQRHGFIQWSWHLDEVFVMINGRLCYLWRAVDHEGEVLDAVVTTTRDKRAALTVLKRPLKSHGRPRQIVTDGLPAYAAAMREIGVVGRHRSGRRSNNRAENSHQPFRRREHAMKRFRSRATLQKSCRFTLRSTITLIWNATSFAAPITSKGARRRWPGGERSHRKQTVVENCVASRARSFSSGS